MLRVYVIKVTTDRFNHMPVYKTCISSHKNTPSALRQINCRLIESTCYFLTEDSIDFASGSNVSGREKTDCQFLSWTYTSVLCCPDTFTGDVHNLEIFCCWPFTASSKTPEFVKWTGLPLKMDHFTVNFRDVRMEKPTL